MTSIVSIRLNQAEYSRYYDPVDLDLSVIKFRIRLDQPPPTGATILVNLTQMKNGEIVTHKLLSTDTTTVTQTGQIDLNQDCFDQTYLTDALNPRQIYRAKQGWYTINASLLDNTGAQLSTMTTTKFPISIVATAELKRRHGAGFPGLQSDIYAPVKQPQKVTGVTIPFISEGVGPGTFELRWSASDSTLQLAFPHMRGDMPELKVTIDPNADGQTYVLPTTNTGAEGNYVIANVSGWDLPTQDTNEIIIFDNSYLVADAWREYLWEATDWMEGKCKAYLEPTRYTTDYNLDPLAHFSHAQPQGLSNNANQNGFMNAQIPRTPLLACDHLIGKFNNSKVLEVPVEWKSVDSFPGLIHFVPNTGAIQSWLFQTSNYLQFAYGPYPIVPNFWHYAATVGLPDLYDDRSILREMIIKRAMVNILIMLGTAYRGGVAGESTGKDGISTSVNYTSSATVGVYGSDITQYREDLEKELPEAIRRIWGVRMRILH